MESSPFRTNRENEGTVFRFGVDSRQQSMAELPLSSQVGPQLWRTVPHDPMPIAQNSMWLYVVRSARSDAPLLSGIVLDCFGLQDVGGPLS